MRTFFVCFAFFFLGCVGVGHRSESGVEIDQRLLIPWGEALKDVETAQSPALYEFTSGNKVLWYLASQHSNKNDQPVFKLIESVIQKKPDIIIIEGVETDLGFSSKPVVDLALQGIKEGFYPSGEPSYVIELAVKNNIPFIGGEPDDKLILEKIINSGFTAKDLLSFNFVRRMPQINRSGDLNKEKIETVYSKYIERKAKDFGYSGKLMSFAEFQSWYQEKQGKPFSLNAGEKGETAPIEGPYFTQKISLEVTKIRDENILQVISNMLKKYDRVSVVYGSSHYRVQHKALKAALGPAKKIL